jgi:magnesium transporter
VWLGVYEPSYGYPVVLGSIVLLCALLYWRFRRSGRL